MHGKGAHNQIKLEWIPREGDQYLSYHSCVPTTMCVLVFALLVLPSLPSWYLWSMTFHFSEWPVALIFCICQIFSHPTCNSLPTVVICLYCYAFMLSDFNWGFGSLKGLQHGTELKTEPKVTISPWELWWFKNKSANCWILLLWKVEPNCPPLECGLGVSDSLLTNNMWQREDMWLLRLGH